MADEAWPKAFSGIASAVLGTDGSQAGALIWLREAIARYSGLVERVVPGADIEALASRLRDRIDNGETGRLVDSSEIAEMANSSAAGRNENAKLRDYIEAIVRLSGEIENSTGTPAERRVESASPAEPSGPPAATADASESSAGPERASSESAPKRGWADDSADGGSRRTPTLDKYGRDLTAEVRAGALPELFGREAEVETLIEVLCRTSKRNPLLIGPPGSGKTAIVEGLAKHIVDGKVPDFLADVRVVAIETSALVGGTGVVGTFEERMGLVLEEASRPDIILFIDEAHTMMSAGGKSGGLADMLKPALARGELAVIAATTDDEYRRFIKSDRALERRFQPVLIAEMDAEATLHVLRNRRDRLAEQRKVAVDDETLGFLVQFAEENIRSRTFPDKAIDLLEQCVAYASSHKEASVTRSIAEKVASRLVGETIEPSDALQRVMPALRQVGITDDDAQRIATRLQATLHGLDRRTWRPNLVMALGGEAACEAWGIAEVLADALFGSAERILRLDLSQVRNEESISIIIGSPPGYVGYERQLAIHELAVTPRTVVFVEGADTCHPLATEVLAHACADGYFTDTTGGRYYTSDAVVLVPVGSLERDEARPSLGFVPATAMSEDQATVENLKRCLGARLTAEVDLVIDEIGAAEADRDYSSWIGRSLMPSMAELYARRGIALTWDDDVVPLIGSLCAKCSTRNDAERFAEELLSRTVLGALDGLGVGSKHSVRLLGTGQTLMAVRAEQARDDHITAAPRSIDQDKVK